MEPHDAPPASGSLLRRVDVPPPRQGAQPLGHHRPAARAVGLAEHPAGGAAERLGSGSPWRGARPPLSMGTYYRRAGNDVETVEMPLVDTSLSRDGRFVDDRAPGDILSSRTPVDYLDRLEKVQPEVYHAQHQQSPILHTGEGAKVYASTGPSTCSPSPSGCSGTPSPRPSPRPSARAGGSPPGGITGRRQAEICVVLLWHPILQEMWVGDATPTPGRTTPRTTRRGAPAPRRARHPDPGGHREPGGRGLPRKNAADNVARDINTALYWARDKAGPPILGFLIATVKKGRGRSRTARTC